ncbi:MAG: hypothetical protein JST00_20885 [Deltaproteobacteria bacterium]|nr:hypothetical protein [Deltaproteobacteria bacterium]
MLTLRSAALGLGILLALGCDKEKPKPESATPPSSSTTSTTSTTTNPTATSSTSVGAGGQASARGSAAAAAAGSVGHDFGKVEFPEVPIRAGATTTVHVKWKAPPGTGVNEEAPFKVRWDKSDALSDAPIDVKATGSAARDGFEIKVKPLDGAPNATLGGVIDLVVCDVETHSVCVPVRRKVDIEFVVGKAHGTDTTVTVELPHARPQKG